tara:strand:- start:722 stop:886 length:165 start_codon:yes stop_codon:yes gene_type:complete
VSLALFVDTTPVLCTWLIKVSGRNVWMPVGKDLSLAQVIPSKKLPQKQKMKSSP